jgi:hypothetical protein
MRGPALVRRRRSRLLMSLALATLGASSCERSLEGAPCPCLAGWTCCSDNRCHAGECPSNADGGETSAGTGAVAGEGDASGRAGMSGSVGGGTETGGTAGGDSGESAGGVNEAGSGADLAQGHATLPRFCNALGWCGARHAFHAVWGASASDVWVVGRSQAEFGENAFLHWDGQRWLNTPNGTVGPWATVLGVWGSGPDDVWFVGNDGDDQALVLHWVGGSWSFPSTIAEISELRAVVGLSRDNVWAVGAAGGMARWSSDTWSPVQSSVTVDLNAVWNDGSTLWAVGVAGTVLSWDGREASASPSSEIVSDVDLNAVWGTGSGDIWIAGDAATLLHRDGDGWSQVTLGELIASDVDFEAMTGDADHIWLAASDGSLLRFENGEWDRAAQGADRLSSAWSDETGEVWAVGDRGASVHFGDQTWVTSNEPVTADLFGVWGSATNDVWAVGDAGSVLHWDGRTWSPASTPATDGNWTAISGTSSKDVWAVGSRISHFDGSEWSIALDESPAPLRSACAVASDDAWAVGDRSSVLHWDGLEWLPSELPSELPDMNLTTVWCSAADEIWAIDAVQGAMQWNGASWSTTLVYNGTPNDVLAQQILTGSAADDVWILNTISNADGNWLVRNHWNGNWATDEISWSVGIPTTAYPTARGDFWLVGSMIWHVSAGIPVESYVAIGATMHGVWAPREPVRCDESLQSDSTGPNGAWAVGSAGTLLDKQCIRTADLVIGD